MSEMETIDEATLERLLRLADELPVKQKQDLLRIIKGWDVPARATRSARAPYFDKVLLVSATGEHHGRARNLSISGVFVETYSAFKLGDRLTMTLVLITSPEPIKLFGEVKRIAYDGIGICFHHRNKSEEAMLRVAIDQRQHMLDIMDGEA